MIELRQLYGPRRPVMYSQIVTGRIALAVALAGTLACTSSTPPAAPSNSPASDPGPPPAIPTTDGATLMLSSTGVSPQQVRVYQGSRVTFVNNDSNIHEIQSNPLHVHTDCPELNVVSFLVPGQSRSSTPLTVVRGCGFHDHVNESDSRFYGAVFVDPR
jgi:hypothetical protein